MKFTLLHFPAKVRHETPGGFKIPAFINRTFPLMLRVHQKLIDK